MQMTEVIEVVEELAMGRDPDTGELLPADTEFAQPRAIRALFLALDVLRARARRGARAGQPWSVEDEARLAASHASGKSPKECARLLERTPGAVKARLVKLGLLDASEAAGLRYPV